MKAALGLRVDFLGVGMGRIVASPRDNASLLEAKLISFPPCPVGPVVHP